MVGVARKLQRVGVTPFTRRRVMIVSAAIGGGHDAIGHALREVVERCWPGSEIRWVDTLARMGRGVGPSFRWIYTRSVEHAPWLYDVFYQATWRHRWFADASKRFTGSWAGRRLAAEIDAFAPEIILSTYPLGSGGLAWLRRHRGLDVATAAWVTDFAAHPFWVYADIDTTFVMHETALAGARLIAPTARLAVSALPVRAEFQPGDQRRARERFGLRPEAFVVLVSCGTFAFGIRESMIRALVAADDQIQVVAVCGRNQQAAARLERMGLPRDQLVPLRWTDEMALLYQAADVVVTNAGGATGLEAVASALPVLMLDPIAAHGAANASLMTVAGLAESFASPDQLAARLRGLVADRRALARLGQAARVEIGRRGLAADLSTLRPLAAPADHTPAADGVRGGAPGNGAATSPGDDARAVSLTAAPPAARRPWPMRPVDAFFAHVEAGGAPPQEIGVVLELDQRHDGRPPGLADLRASVAARIPHLLPLRWQPVRRGARTGWRQWDHVDVAAHTAERVVDSAEAAQHALEAFWTAPLPREVPLWQLLLVRQTGADRSLLAVKVHHTMGDGLSALGLLSWLLDAESVPDARAATASADAATPSTVTAGNGAVRTGTTSTGGSSTGGSSTGAPGSAEPAPGSDPSRRARPARAVPSPAASLTKAATGLWSLATRGRAPRHPLNRPVSTGADRLAVFVPFPADDLRAAARRRGIRTFELVLGIVAEGLDTLLRPAGLVDTHRPLRAFFPLRAHGASRQRIMGNWTTAVPVELPTGAMPPGERLRRIRAGLRSSVERGEPLAAGAVMRLTGLLPPAAHAWFARQTYSDRFLNLIVTYLPGPRGEFSFAGAPVRTMYPLAPLTRNVPLSFGMITTSTTAGLGVLVDPALGLDRAVVEAALQRAFAAFVEA